MSQASQPSPNGHRCLGRGEPVRKNHGFAALPTPLSNPQLEACRRLNDRTFSHSSTDHYDPDATRLHRSPAVGLATPAIVPRVASVRIIRYPTL